MFKKIFTLSFISILALTLNFCGKKEEPKEEMKKEEVKTVVDSGLGSKVKAYEDFVTKFCALTDKMKGASATEKVAMMKDFKEDSANLKTLQTDLDAAKDATPEQTAKIKAATGKATTCAASAAGVSAPKMPTEMPKVPKIPGM